MSAIKADIVLEQVPVPPGFVPGLFQVTLFKDSVAQDPQTTADATITFPDVAPGSYYVTALRLSSTAEIISDLRTSNVVVVPEPAPDPAPAPTGEQMAAPASITISLA